MRILYVEDNEVNRALVERVVRARKCSVVFHDEGEDALKTLEGDPTIDLILLDIELAGAISGLDVIRTMRARNDKRPVVAVTAYAMMGDRERILEAGCDQYLPKPLVITELLNMLDHYSAELAAKAAQPVAAAQPAAQPVTAPAVTAPVPAAQPVAAVQPAAQPVTVPAVTAPAPAAQPAAQPTAVAQPVTAPAAVAVPAAPPVAATPEPAAGEITTPAVSHPAAPLAETPPATEAPLSGQESAP